MLTINRLPKAPGWREAVLAGRGQQHVQAGSTATAGNWVSTQQSSLQASRAGAAKRLGKDFLVRLICLLFVALSSQHSIPRALISQYMSKGSVLTASPSLEADQGGGSELWPGC